MFGAIKNERPHNESVEFESNNIEITGNNQIDESAKSIPNGRQSVHMLDCADCSVDTVDCIFYCEFS